MSATPSSTTGRRLVLPRRPAWIVLAGLGCGMIVDRFFSIGLTAWIVIAVVSLLLSFSARLPRLRGLTLLGIAGLLISVGGVRHHAHWSLRRLDNIATCAWETPQLVRLRGIALERVEIDEAEHSGSIPSWMQLDRSLLTVCCVSIQDQGNWRGASGTVELQVNGHLLGIEAGDQLDISGELARPLPPRNPGDLDYRLFLRAQQIDAIIRVDHPLSVRIHQRRSGYWWWLMNTRDELRQQCVDLTKTQLSPRVQPIAASLLLGDRTRLTDELRADFAESGTMHLLAISGLHVGILVGALYMLCRVLNLTSLTTAMVLITTALGYGFITDIRPPVMRAVLFTILGVCAQLRVRAVNGVNLLCLTAVILLLIRPSDLFDVGAQLSFLAVWAISVTGSWFVRRERNVTLLSAADDLPREYTWLQKLTRRVGWSMFQAYVVTAGIWIATLPLTIATFHLFTPVGFFVNALLIPFAGLTLVLGFVFLVGGLIVPPAAFVLAAPFDWSLSTLLAIVDWCSELTWGHCYLPDVPLWWLLGFYLLLALWWGLWLTQRFTNWGWRGLIVWTLIGFAGLLFSPARNGLRCTFLAVGHGNAVLIELPDGRTLLYDGGTFGRGSAATRTIERALWQRHITRVDAVIISHADVDHFNGVSGLLPHVAVGTICCARSFLDFRQLAVDDLCEATFVNEVPIRLCHAGDQLVATDVPAADYELTVLHPARDWQDEDDNANSIVLEIKYANRRILLTGDIEGAGLAQLMQQIAGPCDLLMSPHHGSKASNPEALYDWMTPANVVVSTGDEAVLTRLQSMADSSRVFSTANSGAVTCLIAPDGDLEISPFRH